MSVKYIDKNGNVINASGLTPGGNLEAGAVATRTGTATAENVPALGGTNVNVTFDTSMPDADYDVFLYIELNSEVRGTVRNRTANGFTIATYNTANQTLTATFSWKAVKTYTVQHDVQNTEAIAAIQAAIPAGAGTANQLTTKSYVDNANDALSNRIADVEDVIPHTATITNHLVTVDDLQNVEIDVDDELSSTSTNPVENKVVKEALDTKQNKVFIGTLAQWNALAPSQANEYELVNIIDDDETGGSQNYLTTEIKTGEKWIDGKDIYRLSFVQNNPYTSTKPSSNAEISVTTNLTSYNIDKIIKWDAITTWSGSGSNTPQYYFPTDVTVAADSSGTVSGTSVSEINPCNYTRQYYAIGNKTAYFNKNGRYYNYGIQAYSTIYYTKK